MLNYNIYDKKMVNKVINLLPYIPTYLYFNNNFISLIDAIQITIYNNHLVIDSNIVAISTISGLCICSDCLASKYNCFSIYLFSEDTKNTIILYVPLTHLSGLIDI